MLTMKEIGNQDRKKLESFSNPCEVVPYSRYQQLKAENCTLKDEILELRSRVDPESEDCYSIADSLEKEYSSERGIVN